MKTKIYEMPVYCGMLKVWRVLNIATGTVYSSEHRTEHQAFKSIEHNTKRAGGSIAEVLWQIPAEFLDRAVAFEIVDKPKNATDLNDESEAMDKGFHVSTVRIYGN